VICAIPGLARDLGCAVADPPRADRSVPPFVFVHGIHDNIHRWLHPIEGLPDPVWNVPTFDPVAPPQPIFSPRFERKRRFLETLDARGLRGLAFSYQRPNTTSRMIRPLAEAVDGLATMVDRARERFDADRVTIVGHSRGGLVARSYLARRGSAAKVHSLVTLATPHEGSGVASVSEGLLARVAKIAAAIRAKIEIDVLADFETLLDGYCSLTTSCDDVESLRKAGFPSLPGGIAAAAGDLAAFLRFKLPFYEGALPGVLAAFAKLDIPEFADGQGDMVVSVASALAVPKGSPTRVFHANHLTICHDADAIEWVVSRVAR